MIQLPEAYRRPIRYNYGNSNFDQNDFFTPLDSLLSPTSDGVNTIVNFLLIKKLLMKTTIVRNYCFV